MTIGKMRDGWEQLNGISWGYNEGDVPEVLLDLPKPNPLEDGLEPKPPDPKPPLPNVDIAIGETHVKDYAFVRRLSVLGR